jgi:hypothetical protein
MMRSGRNPRGRSISIAAATVALATWLLTGCSAPAGPPITLDDVSAERAAAREVPERQRFAAFVEQSGDQLVALGLTVPQFQRMVSVEQWAEVIAECINTDDFRSDLTPTDEGFTVNYFGVVGDDFERSALVISSCEAQYGLENPTGRQVAGVIEAAWRYDDATQRVLPCLRHIDAAVPSPPSSVAFIENLGTGREWTPYALIASDPAALARAITLCPPSSTLLAAHLEATNER